MNLPVSIPKRLAALWSAVVLVTPLGVAQVPEFTEGPLIMLPPLMVEEKTVPVPWHYYQSPNLEVLAACSDRIAGAIVQRLQQLDAMMPRIIPSRFLATTTVPETVILIDEAMGQGMAKDVLGDRLKSSKSRIRFMPNLRLPDRDAMVTFAMVNKDSGPEFSYSNGRIGELLERRTPALPDWFILGMTSLYPKLAFGEQSFRVGPADWLSREEARALAASPDRPRTLLPTEEMFTRTRRTVTRDEGDQIWRAQCTLFMYWTLVADDGARREALWRLVDRLDREPMSEKLFREQFGLGYSDLRDELSDYLAQAVRPVGNISMRGGTINRPPPPPPVSRGGAAGGTISGVGGLAMDRGLGVPDFGNPPPGLLRNLPGIEIRVPPVGRQPRPAFRKATELEIARIRGDFERLEISVVRGAAPELVPDYVKQARNTLLRPYYEKGERDPRLLVVLGLTEIEAGNPGEALPYLEAAVQGGVQRPRAYFELARLRYLALAGTAGGVKTLTAEQVQSVVGPLLLAHAFKPALPEVYALMSDTLVRGPNVPTEPQLAALFEGAMNFPSVSALMVRTIALHAVSGQSKAVAALRETALRHAPDEAARARIEQAAGAPK
jgi:hypothetical protein